MDMDKYHVVMDNWMELAAAIYNSGYKEQDTEFTEGHYKWWHDLLEDAVMDYNKMRSQQTRSNVL